MKGGDLEVNRQEGRLGLTRRHHCPSSRVRSRHFLPLWTFRVKGFRFKDQEKKGFRFEFQEKVGVNPSPSPSIKKSAFSMFPSIIDV